MSSLQDLIKLAKVDGGKFFVIDESGDTKLVIMPVEEYQHLLLGKLQRQIQDVEQINKEIIKAQLSEEQSQRPSSPVFKASDKGPVVTQKPAVPRVDLRAEVIDPSFDFEGPKTEIDDL